MIQVYITEGCRIPLDAKFRPMFKMVDEDAYREFAAVCGLTSPELARASIYITQSGRLIYLPYTPQASR